MAAAETDQPAEAEVAGYTVTGAAVVLATVDGSERYLYRGALVGGGFTDASIEHALSVGLITETK